MRGLLMKDFYSLKKIKNMYLILTGILGDRFKFCVNVKN